LVVGFKFAGTCALRPNEIPDENLQMFYHSLHQALQSKDVRDGEWNLCEQATSFKLLACTWIWGRGLSRFPLRTQLIELDFGERYNDRRFGWNGMR